MIIYKTKIQWDMYSESWCFAHNMLSSMPSWDLCKMCGRPRQEFFSWSTLHAWIFLGTSSPPSPYNFSKGPSLSFPEQKRLVSSANKIVYSLLVELLRLLMYINNSNGPRMEPCGTPQVTFFCWPYLILTNLFGRVIFYSSMKFATKAIEIKLTDIIIYHIKCFW